MNIMTLYDQASPEKKEKFQNAINSNVQVKEFHDENKYDDEWLTKMEETIVGLKFDCL